MNDPSLFERIRVHTVTWLGVLLCLFTLWEVNFPALQSQSALAVFVMLGMVLCYLVYPAHPKLKDNVAARSVDVLLALATVACCGYVIVQIEPACEAFWLGGKLDETVRALGNRAGDENGTDVWVGIVGLVLVLEATRRSIGWIVPGLALAFVVHSYYCYGSETYGWTRLPGWLLPHQGQSLESISIVSFIQSQGVFGTAAGVMFKYVFLFVVFGSFLEMSGATQFVIDFAKRVLGNSPGGPAKVSVLGSGLMGSLSGSAVANAVTTGAFTIPMMRNSGFSPTVAGGITAAAASGGALVPPVMGAGAYMMIELVQPQVRFVDVATAAAIPAVLYYLSLLLIVHFYSKKIGVVAVETESKADRKPLPAFEGIVFFGALAVLITRLGFGKTVFRAVSESLVFILLATTIRGRINISQTTRMLALGSFALVLVLHQLTPYAKTSLPLWMKGYVASPWTIEEVVLDEDGAEMTGDDGKPETVLVPDAGRIVDSLLQSSIMASFGLLIFGLANSQWRPEMTLAFTKSSKNGISLVAASACVGVIIGIVTATGIAGDLSAEIKKVVESNLLLALVGIMGCSIFLGMGVPSVVCYLLMATLMSTLLSDLGVIPLAAHLFIFYFGMMSMVTPPVALAAYASASIAEAPIMKTAFAAFRFSLVGFTLPFMFVYRPELLLLSPLPDVEVSLARPKEVKVGEPADVSGTIKKFGKPVKDAELFLLPADGSASEKPVQGDFFGTFKLSVAPGDYDVELERDDERVHLGRIAFDPTLEVDTAADAKETRLVFTDQRLKLTNVFIAVTVATIGIIALAAGIAGFLFTAIRPEVRFTMLAAAALMLSPTMKFGGVEYGLYANLIGIGIFSVTIVVNYLRSLRAAKSPAPSGASESPSSDGDAT